MKCHLHPDRDAVGYCVTCGQGVCAECRREVAGTIRCPNHTAAAPLVPPPSKSGFLAGLFSMMFPGLGHLYAGAYQRGMRFGGLAVALIVILSVGHEHLAVLFGLSLFFTWVYALFDAIRICHEINRGAYFESAPGMRSVTAVPAMRFSGSTARMVGSTNPEWRKCPTVAVSTSPSKVISAGDSCCGSGLRTNTVTSIKHVMVRDREILPDIAGV